MQLIFSDQPMPQGMTKSIFLAGPSPRSLVEVDWRHEAVQILRDLGYDGTVFLPVPSYRFQEQRLDSAAWSYDNQVEWEVEARKMADIIVFWVPRVIDRSKADLGMPAFTTNFELGEDVHTGKVVYGRPESAQKCRYLDKRVEALGGTVHASLHDVLADTLVRLGEGAVRAGGEARVPLLLWRTPAFQAWYANLKVAGNRLDDADLTNAVFIGGKHLFAFTLKVKVWVAAEQRHKSNEFVLFRSDLGVVVALHHDDHGPTHLALVREFRSQVNNAAGYVYELPGGSSVQPGVDARSNASHELHEELGLAISDLGRLKPVGVRQLAATLCAHRAHVYAVELTAEEFSQVRQAAHAGQVFGLESESERTHVAVTTLDKVWDLPLDYSMLGIVHEAVRVLR